MNKSFLILITVIIAVFTFSSCSKKTNSAGRYVPQKAVFVFHINGASINQKLPWEEIKNTSMFKKMMEDSSISERVRTIFKNPESAGINLKNDLVAFFMKDSLGQYACVEGFLSDADAFAKLARNESKGKMEFSENSGLNTGNGEGMGLVWNKERFLFIHGVSKTENRFNFDKMQLPPSDSVISPYEDEKDTRNYGSLAQQVFNLKESESLGLDEKFSELIADKGDLHFWMNSEELYNIQAADMPAMGPLNMLNFTKLTKDARSTASVNFDNGKILIDYRVYMGKEVADIFKKNMIGHTDAEMIKRIPTENLAMVMQFSVKPEVIKDYLKLLGADGFANMGAGMLGFSVDDIISANKGDYLFAVSNIRIDSSSPKFDYLFSSSIGDKQSFDKVIAGVNKLIKTYIVGTSDSSAAAFSKLYSYNLGEKYFALGANQPLVDGYLAGAKTYSSPVYDKITSGPGGMYINFNYILNALTPLVKDSSALAVLVASKLIWQDMISYSDQFSDNSFIGHAVINLTDKNTNSLKQLNNYFDKIGMIEEAKKQKEEIPISDIPELKSN